MIRWLHAFADRPARLFAESADFWTAVTGSRMSERRGEAGEFATLLPDGGTDACLKIQGVVDGTGGAHLDLAVDDPQEVARRAVALGATAVREHPDLVVLSSPAGQPFCVVPWQGEKRRPDVFRGTRLDQLAIDIPPDAYQAEVAFWGALTGRPVLSGRSPQYRLIRPQAGLPVQILLQRLDEPRATGAHLDMACADRAATRAWHERLGAVLVAEFPGWTVMRDPAGGTYCLTGRDPHTGRLRVP